MIPIEKGVPMPDRSLKYPWLRMEIGDSFFVVTRAIHGIASVASYTGKRYNRTFTCRAQDGGVRVWRTA